jgi:hypothetical protein
MYNNDTAIQQVPYYHNMDTNLLATFMKFLLKAGLN